jgi:hypothetical protein
MNYLFVASAALLLVPGLFRLATGRHIHQPTKPAATHTSTQVRAGGLILLVPALAVLWAGTLKPLPPRMAPIVLLPPVVAGVWLALRLKERKSHQAAE